MSLGYYDKALYNKIHDLFDNVVNADDSSAFNEAAYSDTDTQENASKKKPKITLPLISFWRTGNPPNFEQDGNYPAVLKGRFYDRQGSTPLPIIESTLKYCRVISILLKIRRITCSPK